MRSTRLWLASLLLLTGCATGGPATEFCVVSRPILVSRADVLTDETARQLLSHNETGARVCGWGR
jgi:hypothetical protein